MHRETTTYQLAWLQLAWFHSLEQYSVVIVSTSLVVSEMLRSQSFSMRSSTGLPGTPAFAIRLPRRDNGLANIDK